MAFASNHSEIFGIRLTLLPWTTRIPDTVYSVTFRHRTIATVGLWPRREESKAGEFYDYPQLPSGRQFPGHSSGPANPNRAGSLADLRNPGRPICLECEGQSIRQEVAAQKKLWSFAECPLNLPQGSYVLTCLRKLLRKRNTRKHKVKQFLGLMQD